MTATLDANILVYATNRSDPAHVEARKLVERLGAGPELLYLFWPTVLGYLRIVTHPAILPRPLAPATAIANLTALLSQPHVQSPGEGDGFWDLFLSASGGRARGNEVPDAHLAALMAQYGVTVLYTRDRGFRRFAGIEVRDPFG